MRHDSKPARDNQCILVVLAALCLCSFVLTLVFFGKQCSCSSAAIADTEYSSSSSVDDYESRGGENFSATRLALSRSIDNASESLKIAMNRSLDMAAYLSDQQTQSLDTAADLLPGAMSQRLDVLVDYIFPMSSPGETETKDVGIADQTKSSSSAKEEKAAAFVGDVVETDTELNTASASSSYDANSPNANDILIDELRTILEGDDQSSIPNDADEPILLNEVISDASSNFQPPTQDPSGMYAIDSLSMLEDPSGT